MRRSLLLPLTSLVATCAGVGWAVDPVSLIRFPDGGVPGHYLVRLRVAGPPERIGLTAERLTRDYGGGDARIRHRYLHAATGFAVEGLSLEEARRLAGDPRVAYVEQDRRVRLFGDRADSTAGGRAVRRSSRAVEESGRGVHAFVVDTGIRSDHHEFRGAPPRVGEGIDLVDDGLLGPGRCAVESGERDPLRNAGHGTHVAGVLGGTRHGVAPDVTLHPVRVLDCRGLGLASDFVAGIDWVAGHVARKREDGPYPALIVLGAGVLGPTTPEWAPRSLVDDAVRGTIERGTPVVVAAGNLGPEHATCRDVSPARVFEAITVGASRSSNDLALLPRFSSRGPCVDLHAPGVDVRAAWHGTASETASRTGTSAAAAHVAGLVARLLERDPDATPDAITSALYRRAAYGELRDESHACVEGCAPPYWLARYTPNRLAGTLERDVAEGFTLGVLRGATLHRYVEAVRDWRLPAEAHADTLLSGFGSPFGVVDEAGQRDETPVDAAWHRWEPHIEEISLLRGTVLHRYDFRAAAWLLPLDVAIPHSTWAWTRGPFAGTRDPVDAAWHRFEPKEHSLDEEINEIVMMRGTVRYTFDMTTPLRAIGELHEGVWQLPKDMSRGSFMARPGGPFADGDRRPLSAGYHVREGERRELVLIRGATAHRYDYEQEAWRQPVELDTLDRGAVWSKDRAPFYRRPPGSSIDAAWFVER